MTHKRWLGRVFLLGGWFLLTLVGVMMLMGCGGPPEEEGQNSVEQIWSEIIPDAGTATIYGVPLSLENAPQFINWYNSIELSADEQVIRDTALSQLVAPCCDEYSIDTC